MRHAHRDVPIKGSMSTPVLLMKREKASLSLALARAAMACKEQAQSSIVVVGRWVGG